MHYPNPYDEPQEVNLPTMPGRHTQRAAETLAGGPALPFTVRNEPSAEDLDAVVAEMEMRFTEVHRKRDKAFRRKKFLREAGFWLLMAAAVGMCAWAILQL